MPRLVFLVGLAPWACAPPSEVPLGRAQKPIINGVPASDYPEACPLDMSNDFCSGVVVAPRLILTAAHCVYGRAMAAARYPFHPDSAIASRTIRVKPSGVPHPSYVPWSTKYDVGVVSLDETISLPAFPTLAQSAPAAGTAVVRVGRILDNQLTNSMYKSTGTVSRISNQNLLIDSNTAVQVGDSGGPDFLTSAHEVVGVNSWFNAACSTCAPTTEGLMRVDVVHAWIQQQIATTGGTTGCAVTPCAPNERCDFATGNCVPGCTVTGCPLGTRCNATNQACMAACASTGCPSGEKCDTATERCVPGCTTTGCDSRYWCNVATQGCEAGCSVLGCRPAERCDAAAETCVAGCSVTGCEAGSRCDRTNETCVPGCSRTGCTVSFFCEAAIEECLLRCEIAGCPAGKTCDLRSQLCVEPTCELTGCPAGERCDPLALVCVPDSAAETDAGVGGTKPPVGGCGCGAAASTALLLPAAAVPAGLRRRRPRVSRRVLTHPVDPAQTLPFDGRTYLWIATHDHALDQDVLEFVLRRPAAYLGMIGSRRKGGRFMARLAATGFRPEEVGRFRTPMGLPIGAQGPDKIAVSIVAELIAVSRGEAAAAEIDDEASAAAKAKAPMIEMAIGETRNF